jgi:hypothetical protein
MAGALLDVLDVGKGLGSEHGKPPISAMVHAGRKGKYGSLRLNLHRWASGKRNPPVGQRPVTGQRNAHGGEP